MRSLMILGAILIALGVVALAYEGITYTRSRTVIDIGPIQAKVEEKRTIPLSPVLGGLALASGIILVLAGTRRAQTA